MATAELPRPALGALSASNPSELVVLVSDVSGSERECAAATIRELQAAVVSMQMQIMSLSAHVQQQLGVLERMVTRTSQRCEASVQTDECAVDAGGQRKGDESVEEAAEKVDQVGEVEQKANAESDREEGVIADSTWEIARRVLFGSADISSLGQSNGDLSDDESEDWEEDSSEERGHSGSETETDDEDEVVAWNERGRGESFEEDYKGVQSDGAVQAGLKATEVDSKDGNDCSMQNLKTPHEELLNYLDLNERRRLGRRKHDSEDSMRGHGRPRRQCSENGCTNLRKIGGKCIRHGGGARCSVESCPKGAQLGGKCKSHGGGARCSVDGCEKWALGGGKCVRHGGGKRCSAEGCKNYAVRLGKCIRHGGGLPCSVEACPNNAKQGGKCKEHGGGVRCSVPECSNNAHRGGKCKSHGGALRCPVDGCTKNAGKGGRCFGHGGGVRCSEEGCTKSAKSG